MKKITILLLITVFQQTIIFSQERFALESLIPPAPNAAELGKYGTYPVGTLTGIPEISFSLYEIKSGSLSLPISLSYHASGVQINQKSTDIGLGWSIMAGGQISRTVYSAKDESNFGYFNYTPPSFETLFSTNNYYTMAGYNIIANTGYDLEPDLFTYSVGGKSGKFICNKDKNFVTIPFDPIKIQKNGTTNITFQITDDNGTIYKFDQFSTTISDFSVQRNTPSTWYLTSITSADLTDTISFIYDTSLSDDYITNESYSIGKRMNGSPASIEFVNGAFQTTKSNISYNELLIKKIIFKDGYVQFNRNTPRLDNLSNNIIYSLDEMMVYNTANQLIKKMQFNHGYYYTPNSSVGEGANNRLKLTGFIESGSDLTTKKEYKFDYDTTSLPRFGSYNMDYWGYYNGQENQHLIPTTTVLAKDVNSISFISGASPYNGYVGTESWTIQGANRESSAAFMKAGILNKITYPTGGYSLFDFEPHQYPYDDYINQTIPNGCGNTYGINRFTKKEVLCNFSYLPDANPAAINDPTILADLNINFSASGMINTEMGETQFVTLTNTTTNTIMGTWKHEGDLMIPLTVNKKIILTLGQSYVLKNEVYGTNTVYVNSSMSWTRKTIQHTTKIGGGLRIKSLKNYSDTNVLAKEENYVYGENESGLGVKLFDERYFYRNYEDLAATYFTSAGSTGSSSGGGVCWPEGTYWQRKFLGISKYSSLNHMGSPILYSTVTKYEGTPASNIGKTVYNYNIIQNTTDIPDEFITSSNYGSINNAWNQGELINETIFKKEGTQYITTLKKEYEYAKYNETTENALLFRQSKEFIKLANCFTSGDGPESGNTNYGQGYFSLYQYPIKTGISKKTKETQTIYDQTNPLNSVVNVTTYQFQNPANRYITEIASTNSDNSTKITRTKYPQDLSDAVSTAMISKNILTTPLENKTYKNVAGTESLLSTMQTNYKQIGNLIVRDNIKGSKGTAIPESRILFNQYDLRGNILEQQITGGNNQSFIWGYNKTQPVAKLENIAYNSIPTNLITSIETASDPLTGTEAALFIALNALRTSLPNSMITTYTYLPLVGVSTITDSKGDTVTYTYDSAGRLQFVKDKDGNLLSENQYYYKN
jgi:YD repeat-containing protein